MKVFAQNIENPLLEESIRNIEGQTFMGRLLPFIFRWLIIIGFLMFVLYFIEGGLLWITAGGNSDKVSKARNHVVQALIGLGVIFSVFAVIKIVGWIFGLQGLQDLQLILPRV